jgi:protein-S-isoprenylcysteine O-methyltransferase Ste14
MLIPILATGIRVVWLMTEVPYVNRFAVTPKKNWDQRSGRVWDTANVIELAGLVLGFTHIGRIQTNSHLIAITGLVLLVTGISIRWIAIKQLGKFFTYKVTIKDDHSLIRSGLYGHIRHPSYTGALLAHLGLGLSFSNWFSLALSSLPFWFAALYRIRFEERALTEAFDQEYLEYSRGTKRLIPKLY